jgi:hypothetical protein
VAEFWPNIPRKWPKRVKKVKFPVFFPYETIQKLEFSQILFWYWQFCHILMKWNQRCYFFKGTEFLGESGRIFLEELAKLW